MTVTRPDIQALRGIAVLAVLAYHAKVPFFAGGYLGVDIFFVVSGYLITGLIARGIADKTFSFAQFYWRRAWRLLPAAYVVFFACAVASPWLLTAGEQRDFAKQLLGAVTFTGNIALWLQTGYFEQAAELKPLLHVWSLAIEEQYYLLLPIAMLWIGPRRWRLAAVVATLISAAACFIQMPSMPGAVFYLLPTRAWELGVGSLLALCLRTDSDSKPSLPTLDWLGAASLFCLGALILVPTQAVHPGWATAVACVLTAVILGTQSHWLGVRYGSSLLAWLGDRSYSLYLVHWPLFAFLNSANVSGGGAPWKLRLAMLLVSVCAAAAIHKFIERPLRMVGHREITARPMLALVATGLAFIVASYTMAFNASNGTDYAHRLRGNSGLGPQCDQHDRFDHRSACSVKGLQPNVLVWGDSYAMHWVAGLVSGGLSVVQATKPTCAPVPAIALFSRPKQPAEWSSACLSFNADVQRFIDSRDPAIDIVILASPWNYLFGADVLTPSGRIDALTADRVADLLVAHILDLRNRGNKVVLLAPPPVAGFDIGRCIERKRNGLLTYGGTSDCNFRLQESQLLSRPAREFLQNVALRADVSVIDPLPSICDAKNGWCSGEFGDVIVYRDTGHLSHEGSVALVRRMSLADDLLRVAR